jgi:hypothetical protein
MVNDMSISIPVKSVRAGMVVALRQSIPGQTDDYSRFREVVGIVAFAGPNSPSEWLIKIDGWPIVVPDGAMIEMLPA